MYFVKGNTFLFIFHIGIWVLSVNCSLKCCAPKGPLVQRADRFHFTGFLRGKEVHKMFALSDVYVMPSISEPFGISPLEAMQTNVPSIISKQSGCAEILKYALKVDFWDVDAMADQIYGLLQYPAIAQLAARCGYDEVNSIKWNDVAAKIKGIYQEVIDKK